MTGLLENQTRPSFLRDYQEGLVNTFEDSIILDKQGPKSFIACWSKDSEKDMVHLYLLMWAAQKREGTYSYVLPTGQTSGGASLMRYINMVISKKLIESIDHSANTIYLTNGSTVHLLRYDEFFDAGLGVHNAGIVLSGFNTVANAEELYHRVQFFLKDSKGFLLIHFTPGGCHHFSYKLLQNARSGGGPCAPSWYVSQRSSPGFWSGVEEEFVSDAFQEALRSQEAYDRFCQETFRNNRGVSDEVFNAEYSCQFMPGNMGQIFGKQINDVRESRRIKKLEVKGDRTICVAADVGLYSAPIWILFQCVGENVYILEVISGVGGGFTDYIDAVKKWCGKNNANLGTLYLPNNVSTKGGSSKAPALYRDFLTEGYKIFVVSYEDKPTAIYRCQKMLKHVYFNDVSSVRSLVKALDSYHYIYDEENSRVTNQIKDDWNADMCAVFGYVHDAWRFNANGGGCSKS